MCTRYALHYVDDQMVRARCQEMMVLNMDNKGAVDLANNCSVRGHTRHVDMQSNFL